MKAEEAINVLRNHTQYYVPVEDTEALAMAIESLEKQMPKKPVVSPPAYIQTVYCPICNNRLSWNAHFCDQCGQKILMEDTE